MKVTQLFEQDFPDASRLMMQVDFNRYIFIITDIPTMITDEQLSKLCQLSFGHIDPSIIDARVIEKLRLENHLRSRILDDRYPDSFIVRGTWQQYVDFYMYWSVDSNDFED